MRKSIFDIFETKDQSKVILVPVEQIQASRYQPRLKFDEDALMELADSIRENGLIQPVTVRQVEDHYEIIAGERRFRACKLAGYKEVPCYVMSPSEEQAAQMALVENVQREDLSAIEEARSYLQIMRQSHLTQEQLAKKIGKSQSAIANKIRLLNLPEEVQEGVIDGRITERHARAMLAAPDAKIKDVYHQVIEKDWNVRETEAYIDKLSGPKRVHHRQKTKGFTRNFQIAINTVNQSLKMLEKMGIEAKTETEDAPEEVRMIIRFPKKK